MNRRLRLSAVLFCALAALTSTHAEAQSGLRSNPGISDLTEGARARDPFVRTERALEAECGPTRIEDRDIQLEDFTGDGRPDAIIRIAAACRGIPGYFCGSRGCRTDLWVQDGRDYRLEATLIAHRSEIISDRDGPAVMFDRGPVWRWDGRELALDDPGRGRAFREPGGGAADWRNEDSGRGDAFGRRSESVTDDGPSADDDFRRDDFANDAPPALAEPEPPRGVWRVEADLDGAPQAIIEELRSDGRMALRCGPTRDTFEMLLWPSAETEADVAGDVGAQHLMEFVVDGRAVQTRMMVRRLDAQGPLVEPAIVQKDALVTALRAGSRLLLRNLGDGKPVAILRLSGSRKSLDTLASECRG